MQEKMIEGRRRIYVVGSIRSTPGRCKRLRRGESESGLSISMECVLYILVRSDHGYHETPN